MHGNWLKFPCAISFIGLIVLTFGLRERRMLAVYDETPQVLTCEELGRNGPGENIHVTLTDFRPCSGDAVVYESRDSPGRQNVFVLVYPSGIGEPPAGELRVIVCVSVRDEDEAWEQIASDRLTGIVELLTNRSDQVPHFFTRLHPGLDPDRCLVLYVGWPAPDPSLASWIPVGAGLLVFGLACLAVGIVVHCRQTEEQEAADEAESEWSGDDTWREPLEQEIRSAARRRGVPPDGPVLHVLAALQQAGVLDEDLARLIGGVWSAADADGDPELDPGHFRSTAEQLITNLRAV